ncbi:MAG: hypothetical protein B0D92_07445 [Spirochaeta sp. LUC14_002_19_P3]|nr:MAG: hypothetical protein B0D92_07445 [Spirochaeta sp. LUC14_002_19_P3]
MKTVIAAYCFKGKGKNHKLAIVTSSSGRWLIPKGHYEDDSYNQLLALEEAWEEAGVKGKIAGGPYSFVIDRGGKAKWKIYSVKIRSLAQDWPEKQQRKRRLVKPLEAAELIDCPDLVSAIVGIAETYKKD